MLTRALEVAPDTAEVLLARGLWLVRQGEHQASLPLLLQASQAAPRQARFTYVYAVALHSAGQSLEALNTIDSFLKNRSDPSLLQTAYTIAREMGLQDKQDFLLC